MAVAAKKGPAETPADDDYLEEGMNGENGADEGEESVVKPGHTIHARRKERSAGGWVKRVLHQRFTAFQREVLLYTIFVGCFTSGWFLDRPGSAAFFQADNIKQRFLSVRYDDMHSSTWGEVRDIEGLWRWLQGPMLDALYEEDTPLSGVGNILGHNGIINGVRLRQVRVKPEPCESQLEWAIEAIKQDGGFDGACYPLSTLYNFDTAQFGGIPAYMKVGALAGHVLEVDETPGFVYRDGGPWASGVETSLGSYATGGFMVQLPSYNRTVAELTLADHRLNNWLDPATRALFVDALFYNPNQRQFVAMRLTAEAPPFGGVWTTATFEPLRLERYIGIEGIGEAISEVCFFLLLLRYLFIEALRARDLGAKYLEEFWGLVVIAQAALAFTVLIVRVQSIQAAYEHTQTTAAATLAGEYVDLSHLPRLINSDGNVMAALSIAVYAKLFKQLASVRGVEHIVRVIKKAMAEVVPFLLLWSVLYMGFGLAFYSLFGGQVYHYRNLSATLMTNLGLLMGGLPELYPQLHAVNPTMAPFLYYLLVTSQVVVLMNVFSAIVLHSYSTLKAPPPIPNGSNALSPARPLTLRPPHPPPMRR